MDEGVVLKVTPIPQDKKTQWALLRKCPFGKVHLEAILTALEEEEEEKRKQKQEEKEKEIEEEEGKDGQPIW